MSAHTSQALWVLLVEDVKVVRARDKISEMKYSGLRQFQQRNVHVWTCNVC